MSLWHVIEVFFWSFVFISYLFALFAIIADLFRDRDLAGGWKALWMLFLVFVPFLTALVYLISRGKGMAERGQKQAQQAKSDTDAYIRSVSTSSPAEDISKAKALLDAGTITPQEFENLKAAALAK